MLMILWAGGLRERLVLMLSWVRCREVAWIRPLRSGGVGGQCYIPSSTLSEGWWGCKRLSPKIVMITRLWFVSWWYFLHFRRTLYDDDDHALWRYWRGEEDNHHDDEHSERHQTQLRDKYDLPLLYNWATKLEVVAGGNFCIRQGPRFRLPCRFDPQPLRQGWGQNSALVWSAVWCRRVLR